MEEELLLGLCSRDRQVRAFPPSCSSAQETCSDVGSFDSENESSCCWMNSSSTLKSDEDLSLRVGSPGLFCAEDDLPEHYDEDATRVYVGVTCLGASYKHEDAEEALRTEIAKERDLGPHTSPPILPEYRGVLVEWMRQSCVLQGFSPATFFTAVSILDRFLRASGEGNVPLSALQLAALTCMALAAKVEQQCSADNLFQLAKDEGGKPFEAEAARRMEYQIMTALDWRLRVPTLYTFATMLVHRVTNRPQDGAVVPPGQEANFRATVQQLAELATLDHALTGVSYSRLAVACLLVAESELKAGVNVCVLNSLRTVLPETELQGLTPPVERLYEIYKSVVAQQSQPVQQ
ncbi:hypothetical protein HYH02_007274 [Chlamydomonas schloesseri]|uniref:Uncharacterized protein n=1 Tax=Chlamydomonas schloesseri TaxID=2026947 RepID=A0A836B516_9CHLO|nr:hypothetical protein HYH02_007274 [Chlamydomonas schloesseri]|eukprot:KAG2447817.1 hypothetical protein HYH02_007274 [Chlamydomonas schloesseri]